MDAFARWLVRHPLLTLVANLVVTGVLSVYALRIRVESSIGTLLPADDPEVRFYDSARARFGSDDVAVVGVQARDLFAAETLAKIARLTDALGKIDGVEHVLSLTNAVDPAADLANPPPLLPPLPLSPADVEALKRKLSRMPVYGKNLIADDFSGAAINIFFKNLSDTLYQELGIDRQIRGVLAAEYGSLSFTGAAHIKEVAVQLMRHDLMRFTPIALALVVLVLWLSFRTVQGVVLPVISVALALVSTLGIMVLAGKSLTLGTFILPALLIVIGSSYGIHVMARYYEQVAAEVAPNERVLRALQRVGPPLVISALTTVIGFGALMTNRITAVWDLGCFAVVGMCLLGLTSLTFIPAVLQLARSAPRRPDSGSAPPWLLGALGRLAERTAATRRRTFWASAIVAVLALTGAQLLRVDWDILYTFRPHSEVRRDNETINREIVGSNPFYLVIEGDAPGALARPEVLRQVRDLRAFLNTLPGITASVSLIDYLELLDAGRRTGTAAGQGAASMWEDPARLNAALQLASTHPAVFKSVVTPDFGAANILVRSNLSGSRRIAETLERIRGYVAEHFPADLRVHPTGNLVLFSASTADIVSGQITSLSVALAVMFLLMALMFLSVKVGFLAMLPNVLPIVIFFGVMGWLGIPLNLGTNLIGTIALGLAVDSTVHYMARLNIELKGRSEQPPAAGRSEQLPAMVRTSQAVGPPILYTTVALFVGFLTFAFSNFVPIQDFGILTGVTMVAALGTNLLLLPALLATTKVITLWDLLALRLGEDPTLTIPLFAGLRPGQARIVVLMGHIKHFAPGEFIVRRGECGEEMFLILQGRAEVWVGSENERRAITELRRGEVLGEMGAVRHNRRSADVVAAEAVEALAVNERFLERLQVRYPRIAAQVFLNMTRIVSDRLQRMTDQFVQRDS